MSTIIPIVVSTDNNYVVPTYVMLHSLLRYGNEENIYKIHILLDKQLYEVNKNLFKSITNKYSNASIKYCYMGNVMKNVQISLKHTTIATMYKLLIAEVLKDYKKCIYLDGDILINGDVSQIYSWCIDDYYLAAVRDIEAEKFIKNFNYPDHTPPTDEYVNAGVLLLNLKKIREDNLIEDFLVLSSEKLLYMDQDILNICCYRKIYFLPLKYNTLAKYKFVNYNFKTYPDHILKYFSKEEIKEANDHPVIIHYAQPIKPWHCKYIYQGMKFDKYIHKYIDRDIYKDMIKPYIKANQFRIKLQISNYIRFLLRKVPLYKYFVRM